MRILHVNWTARRAGGVESYLQAVLPALAARDLEVALLALLDAPADRAPISPPGVPLWIVERDGRDAALAQARAWGPDVVVVHNMDDLEFAAQVRTLAPAVFYAHAYYGTCISGDKVHKFPRPEPCSRRLGPPCLALYLPRRCGGLSPVTMVRRYRHERKRESAFGAWRAIMTASAHMRTEYERHAPPGTPVYEVTYPLALRSTPAAPVRSSHPARRLLMVSRLDRTKGGGLLLDAVPLVAARLGRPIDLLIAGDGPERRALERRAARVAAAHPNVTIALAGWLDGAALERAYTERDLLVVPSIWPEPFGLVGAEAGARGMPAVAFAVGGIVSWLRDGENGHLAPGKHPDSHGLADALARALADDAHLARLGEGARRMAASLDMERHLAALLPVLAAACRSDRSERVVR
jgi:glycosyltransferase involved in cell wall biosynthesis